MQERDLEALTPAERKAFAQLAERVGFASEVHFGRGNTAKLLRMLDPRVLYAMARVDRISAYTNGISEYRLCVALPEGEVLVPEKRKGPRAAEAAERNGKPKFDRSSPAFIRKLRRAQKKAWEARREKYGPRGFMPGKEPWKKAQAVFLEQRRAGKREQEEAQAPERPLRTF